MYSLKIKNISPFVREVEANDYPYIEARIYREWRPWVWGVILGVLTGFCIWLWMVVQVGAILLGK